MKPLIKMKDGLWHTMTRRGLIPHVSWDEAAKTARAESAKALKLAKDETARATKIAESKREESERLAKANAEQAAKAEAELAKAEKVNAEKVNAEKAEAEETAKAEAEKAEHEEDEKTFDHIALVYSELAALNSHRFAVSYIGDEYDLEKKDVLSILRKKKVYGSQLT